MSAKLMFFYESDGGITLACSEGDYKATFLSDDLFPTENGWLYKLTVDNLYIGLRHLRQHALKRSLEGVKDNADDSSSVRS